MVNRILVIGLLISLLLPSSVLSSSIDHANDGFYLNLDDNFGLKVENLTFNNTDEININAQDENGNDIDASLSAGDFMVFSIQDGLPDWSAGSEDLVLQGKIVEGIFNLSYSPPWTIDPSSYPIDKSPLLFVPMIPIGSDTFYDAIMEDFGLSGYSVTQDPDFISVGFSNTTVDAEVSFNRVTGLLHNYTYTGPASGEDGVETLSMEILFDWVLSPSHAQIGFWDNDPLIDYRVINAKNQTVPYVDLFINQPAENGPIDGFGWFIKDDIVHLNFHELRDGTEGAPGYEFKLEGGNGYIVFNTTLELPSLDPYQDGLYLYPLFPTVDKSLVEGYLSQTKILNGSYSYNFTEETFSLNYISIDMELNVSWSSTTGVLTHWMLNETNGIHLEFELLSSQKLENLDIHWGVEVGDGATYSVDQLNFDGENVTDFESGDASGYLEAGDLLFISVREIIANENGPDNIYYDLLSNHGSQTNSTFGYPYPGSAPSGEGPPILPHHLLGNADAYEWIELLYNVSGADHSLNDTHITLNWQIDIITGILNLHSSWRLNDGVLFHTYIHYDGTIDDSYTLELTHLADENLVPDLTTSLDDGTTTSSEAETSETSTEDDVGNTSDGAPGLPFPFVMVLPVLLGIAVLTRVGRKNE